jgi:hypothetical protein
MSTLIRIESGRAFKRDFGHDQRLIRWTPISLASAHDALLSGTAERVER